MYGTTILDVLKSNKIENVHDWGSTIAKNTATRGHDARWIGTKLQKIIRNYK